MSPAAMSLSSSSTSITTTLNENRADDDADKQVMIITNNLLQKGVKNLCDRYRIHKLPSKYILPISDRPQPKPQPQPDSNTLQLPVIDFQELHGPNRIHVLNSIAHACQHYGFFQVINHGIESEVVNKMLDASKRFFELPVGEREKLMSNNMFTPVRYGTSFNQNKDGVFCWRDFLKLSCPPAPPDDHNQILSLWPSSPVDFRGTAVDYAKKTKRVYETLMEGILETLEKERGEESEEYKFIREGNQMMVVNCYPACPQPELTLGMPPHSDYGLLTLLLQDQHVQGLEIYHESSWLPVRPIPSSFVVNVGDHLEIMSNGRYKSVLHRVLVNSLNSRISVASLHTVPITTTVRPLPTLIDQANPKRYMDTDFATFLEYVSSCEPKAKFFLDSRKLFL